jgi:integrase
LFNPAYLQVSRNGIFYLRWPIPRRFHPSKKQTSVRLSLRVRDPREALRLSRAVAQTVDAIWDADWIKPMRYDEIRKALKNHFASLLTQRVEKISSTGRLTPADKTLLENTVSLASDSIDGQYALLGNDSLEADTISRMMAQLNFSFAVGSPQYEWIKQELKRSHRDFAKAVLKYDADLDSFDFRVDASQRHDAQASTGPRATLTELADAYVKERNIAGQWASKTLIEKQDHLNLLLEIIGRDTDISLLSAQDTKHLKETLFVYPKNRSKNPLTRDKPLKVAIAVSGVEKIQIRTANKYLQTYSDLGEWAYMNGYAKNNVFANLRVKQKKKTSDIGRSPFSDTQINMILDAILSHDNNLVRKTYQRWGTLIGIYTGARLNEICQLHVTDIQKVDDVWCFDLNDDGLDKKLKAAASKRRVPIHPRLIDLGLLTYVEQMRSANQTKMFPEFTYCVRGRFKSSRAD